MTSPEISVVMSVFNGERHLRDAAESILGQEGVDLEFVIIDDGSTDGSGEILAELAGRDPRVRVAAQENGGLTRALIRGCREARGRYIARQDADDRSLPGRLRRLRDALESTPDAVFASSWGRTIGPEGETLAVIERPADPVEATRAMIEDRQGPPAHGTVLFDREAYEGAGGYREAFYYGQDSDLWLRLIDQGAIVYVQEVLYEYRYWPANISVRHRELQRAFGRLGRRCLDERRAGRDDAGVLAEAESLSRSIREGRSPSEGSRSAREARGYYTVGACLDSTEPATARRYYRRALAANPFHLKAWLRWLASSARGSGRGAGEKREA